jgi:hypothetical protein
LTRSSRARPCGDRRPGDERRRLRCNDSGYDAKTKKVYSVNAEAPAPRLATIEWYKEHNGGKLPISDSLLSGTVPAVVDAGTSCSTLGHDELW